MNMFLKPSPFIVMAALCGIIFSAHAQNPADYESRREQFIDTALSNFSANAIVLQAYRGLPVNLDTLDEWLAEVPVRSTSDFVIVRLMRILFLSNGAYDSRILPVLNAIPFWLTKGDTLRNYWTENHMIMWMSSEWLLHERYGKAIDGTLETRLKHYLNMKIEYGFYEFFSSTYSPYTLSGLLNLVDFAQDAEIKSLATRVAQRLLSEMLMLTNDRGVYYPAAGRNYTGRYARAYQQNHNNVIYLLMGAGEPHRRVSHGGCFLATSSLPVDTVIQSWTPTLDTVYAIGHSLDSGFVYYGGQAPLDRMMFLWSGGAYFHPQLAYESALLLNDSLFWDHVDFKLFNILKSISPDLFPQLSENLSALSKSSLIMGQDVSMFKHHSVTLSSIQDFWKGKVGYQQFPCVANAGTTAVFTASGKPESNWESRNSNNANIHLPYVKQKSNVAFIMYRPEITPTLPGVNLERKEVSLHWRENDFDEVSEDALWLFGRQGDGYVAVRRHCDGTINGVYACPTVGGQTWVIIVGNSIMYGNFNDFRDAIAQSEFSESFYRDSASGEWVYSAAFQLDTIAIDYTWAADTFWTTAPYSIAMPRRMFGIFPNPASDEVRIELNDYQYQSFTIRIFDIEGRDLFREAVSNYHDAAKTINTSSWQPGLYFITIEQEGRQETKKLMLNR